MKLVRSVRDALRRWRQVRALRQYFSRQLAVPRACPLCGTSDARLLVRGDRDDIGIRTSQCEGCGFVFSSPHYSEPVVADFYRERYRALFKGQPDPRTFAARQAYLRERSVFYQRWLREQSVLPGPGGSVLDVGCGEGTLLRALRHTHPDLHLIGVEPTVSYAQHVSAESGIAVVGDIADLPPGRKFDLVILIHVLEHVYDPVALLRRIRDHLAEQGVLYLDVPDAAMHASVNDLHLAHCSHFSVHTVRSALERTGFAVRRLHPHQPPTLPPSIFAIAGRAGSIPVHPPVSPDPEGRAIAQRIAAIDVARVSFVRRRARRIMAGLRTPLR